MKTTIGEYLLSRLQELGVEHAFGIPGDYALHFLEQLIKSKKIAWIGNCNELCAAYAADGYARIKGASVLITPFGVGELSAINGIAGAYAEHVPIVNIVGMPSREAQQNKMILHHSLGDGDFQVFAKMYDNINAAQTILLNPETAAEDIDQTLRACWLNKQPVYIGIPSDIPCVEIEVEQKPLGLSFPPTEPHYLSIISNQLVDLIKPSKNPIILIDLLAVRYDMHALIKDFIEQSHISFATRFTAKGFLNESHPLFAGHYAGNLSSENTQQLVEASDCVITFGSLLSDLNTGGFTENTHHQHNITINPDSVSINTQTYSNVFFNDVIQQLNQKISPQQKMQPPPHSERKQYQAKEQSITQARFWQRMQDFIPEDAIVLAEPGTSLFGSLPIKLADRVTYLSQILWLSIGYCTPATLGACLAAPNRQSILFAGDGAFQVTAQELSSLIWRDTHPIIFVINNDGYTVERAIHGPTMSYNDINQWRYSKFPEILGDDVWTAKVSTEIELEKTLTEIVKEKNKLRFVEVVMDKNDVPHTLQVMADNIASLNRHKK